MTSNPLFSVVIPAYNAGSSISSLINKFIKQDYGRMEIIVVDDGSQDDTYTICQVLSSKHSCLTVLHQENQGVSAARNLGLQHASGDYILFVDSDDDISTEYVARICYLCEHTDADLIQMNWFEGTHQSGFIDGLFGIQRGFIPLDDYIDTVLQQRVNPPWNKIYKKSIIDAYGLTFNTMLSMGEDLEFALKYLEHVSTVYMSSDKVYYYIINPNGVCAKASLSYFADIHIVLMAMKRIIKVKNTQKNHQHYADDSFVASVFRFIGGCVIQGISFTNIYRAWSTSGVRKDLKKMSNLSFPARIRWLLIRLNLYHLIAALYAAKNRNGIRI